MEDTRFDMVARSLARASASARAKSRRHVLSGVLGGTFAVLAGSSSLANRGKLRRARRGGQGQAETATASDVLPEGVLVGGIWEETLQMCHYDPQTGGYRIVPVSTIAVPERLSLGDTLYIDCCVFSDCASTDCFIAKSCISGACSYDVALNATCHLGNNEFGICRSDAVCVPTSTGAQVAEVAVG